MDKDTNPFLLASILPASLQNVALAKPTLDRPFGVHLYHYFEHGYHKVTGTLPSRFAFRPGMTPLSTPVEVFGTCIAYYTVIFGGQYLMRRYNIAPKKMTLLFQIHNALLTFVSAFLLCLFMEQLIPIIARHGLFFAVCDERAWTQELEVLYYMNYLVKYWELIDTDFLVLRRKKLEFLHYYHHSMTMVLCWTQLVGQTSVSWTVITLNLLVHCFMYYYYLRTSTGARLWWKQYLTSLQIAQFIVDLSVVYYCSWTLFASRYDLGLADQIFGHREEGCAGTEGAAWFGVALLSSYLGLFVKFYRDTYKAKKPKAKRA